MIPTAAHSLSPGMEARGDAPEYPEEYENSQN